MVIEVERRWRRKLEKNKRGNIFELAKKAEQKQSNKVKRVKLRRTPLNMLSESVNHNEYESSADIWAC